MQSFTHNTMVQELFLKAAMGQRVSLKPSAKALPGIQHQIIPKLSFFNICNLPVKILSFSKNLNQFTIKFCTSQKNNSRTRHVLLYQVKKYVHNLSAHALRVLVHA